MLFFVIYIISRTCILLKALTIVKTLCTVNKLFYNIDNFIFYESLFLNFILVCVLYLTKLKTL